MIGIIIIIMLFLMFPVLIVGTVNILERIDKRLNDKRKRDN